MWANGVSAYDEKTRRGLVRHVFVRTNRAGEALVCLVVNGEALPKEEDLVRRIREALPDAAGVVLSVNTRDTNVVLGDKYRTLWGADTLEDTLCGLTFRLSLPAFFQVNRDQAERLARNGIQNAEFLLGDAGDVAGRLAGEHLRPDVVVVDPPRKGLGPEVAGAVAAMGPERVVYVSCDPGTLARDVRRFAEAGYAAVRVAAVDMFPRTRHVETVVCLGCGVDPIYEANHISTQA